VKNIPLYDRYVGALVAFMKELVQQGHAIRLFATDSPDALAIDDIMEHFKETDMAGRISRLTIETVEDLMSFLLTTDYVVASRLHGTILSHLMNRPVLAISYDAKVDVHMEQMGQSRFCVDIHTATAETLCQTFASLVDNREAIKQSLRKSIHGNSTLLSRQYDSVLQWAWDGAQRPSPQTTTSERRKAVV
jgi:polysaccharide pyruvyl transferase WcaK-like protein